MRIKLYIMYYSVCMLCRVVRYVRSVFRVYVCARMYVYIRDEQFNIIMIIVDDKYCNYHNY